MDAAIEENVQHMDISEANKDQTQEPKNEIICEPGPSNAGTPEAELVINEPEVPKSPVKEKCKTPDKNDCIYHIKWISRDGCKSPVITQVNGLSIFSMNLNRCCRHVMLAVFFYSASFWQKTSFSNICYTHASFILLY